MLKCYVLVLKCYVLVLKCTRGLHVGLIRFTPPVIKAQKKLQGTHYQTSKQMDGVLQAPPHPH